MISDATATDFILATCSDGAGIREAAPGGAVPVTRIHPSAFENLATFDIPALVRPFDVPPLRINSHDHVNQLYQSENHAHPVDYTAARWRDR